MKTAEQNGGGGRGFVIAFVADMDKRGVLFTAGETVEVQMQQIIDAGLPDVSFTGFLEMTAAYTTSSTHRCAHTPRRTPRSPTSTKG